MPSVRFRLNGVETEIDADPDRSVLDILRCELGMTGTHFGCGAGECGACNVMIGNLAVAACDTPLWSIADKDITTVEGLGSPEQPHPLQRAFIAEQWGVPAARIPLRVGKTATEIFAGLGDGSIRAVWVLATNPAASLPDLESARRALRRAELVVVHEAFFPTDTAALAHVVLPAAGWAEKDAAMTNSERVVTLSRKLVDAPGDALPDWQLLARLAHELGFGAQFAWQNAAEVFDEFRALTAGTSCDLSGITHARLADGPLQWPCPAEDHPGTARRYEARFATTSGRARFVAVQPQPPAEPVSRDFPLVLNSGRLKSHWHTRSRTRWSKNLEGRAPEPVLEMNPSDARRVGVVDGGFAEVRSRRGEVVAQVRITTEIAAGSVFLPFHWTRLDGFLKPANNLTHGAIDPISKQPELKHCAVRVRALATPEELSRAGAASSCSAMAWPGSPA